MTDKEKLTKAVKLADAMYYAAQYLTTDASRLHKAMEEYHQFIIHEYFKEEPVSEDLEEASVNYAATGEFLPNGKEMIDFQLEKAFKAGAKWQKEQMMEKSIDGDITFDYYGDDDKTYGCIAHDSFCLEDFGLKDRDKVRMIFIKEG